MGEAKERGGSEVENRGLHRLDRLRKLLEHALFPDRQTVAVAELVVSCEKRIVELPRGERGLGDRIDADEESCRHETPDREDCPATPVVSKHASRVGRRR
jgi:hypothetical protein